MEGLWFIALIGRSKVFQLRERIGMPGREVTARILNRKE